MLLIVDIIVLFVLVVSKLAFGGISTWVFILFSEYPTLRLLPLPPILRYLFFPLPPPPIHPIHERVFIFLESAFRPPKFSIL